MSTTRPAEVTIHVNPNMDEGDAIALNMATEKFERLGKIVGDVIVRDRQIAGDDNAYGVPADYIGLTYRAEIETRDTPM